MCVALLLARHLLPPPPPLHIELQFPCVTPPRLCCGLGEDDNDAHPLVVPAALCTIGILESQTLFVSQLQPPCLLGRCCCLYSILLTIFCPPSRRLGHGFSVCFPPFLFAHPLKQFPLSSLRKVVVPFLDNFLVPICLTGVLGIINSLLLDCKSTMGKLPWRTLSRSAHSCCGGSVRARTHPHPNRENVLLIFYLPLHRTSLP